MLLGACSPVLQVFYSPSFFSVSWVEYLPQFCGFFTLGSVFPIGNSYGGILRMDVNVGVLTLFEINVILQGKFFRVSRVGNPRFLGQV